MVNSFRFCVSPSEFRVRKIDDKVIKIPYKHGTLYGTRYLVPIGLINSFY